MLVTPVECIGLAKVDLTVNPLAYVFANGFDTGTPEGAALGATPISLQGPGDFIVFLDTPQDIGEPGQQGGLVCTAMSDAGLFCTVQYAPTVPPLPPLYAGVNVKKAIRIRSFDAAGAPAAVGNITLMVNRNAHTVYPHP